MSVDGGTGPVDSFQPVTAPLAATLDTIRALGLERHVFELDTQGYTVVDDALDTATTEELGSLLSRLANEDRERGARLGWVPPGSTREVMLLLSRGGPAVERLVMHDRVLPLITYLLGSRCTISSVTGYVKQRGDAPLGVHSDTAYVPDPLPPYAQLANVNYCLTRYTAADGCLTMVPGSHRYCHRPRDGQGASEAVPIEAPPGAAIVFHGNTWHGALPRTRDGLRLTISTLYCRMYMRPQERYDEIIGAEVLDRNPPRFRTLVGLDVPTGWRSVDDAERVVGLRRAHAPTFYRTRSGHT